MKPSWLSEVHEVWDTVDGDVMWQIQDSGEWMSAEALATLGQPSATRSFDDEPGAGLGVAFAWGIVEKHGGLIRFESALGVGTTTTVWVPGRN